MISKLQHPCSLKFIGYSPINFDNSPNPLIISELASNGSLDQLLKLQKQNNSIPVIYGIASAMSYLHSNKILHTNLKPQKILLDDYLLPKISDFGLSIINHDLVDFIYIAPEAVQDEKYTEYSDVYSFSLIVYEIITGQIPFENLSFPELVQKVYINGYRPEFNKPIPNSYRKLIESCWNTNANKRPPFDQIVKNLKSDNGFITDSIEKDSYFKYIEYIEQSQISMKTEKKIDQKMSDMVNSKSKVFKRVFLPYFITSSSHVSLYPETAFNKLHNKCQIFVLEAEEDFEKQMIVGQNLIEGINGFPQNSILGVEYLKHSMKSGNIEAAILYSRIHLEGKYIPPNPAKVTKNLTPFLSQKNAIVYLLYGRAMKHQKNYKEALSYFKKASDLGNAESMFEYALMLHKGEGIKRNEKQSIRYLEMSRNNGYNRNFDDDTSSINQLVIIDFATFSKLNKTCQKQVIEAENNKNDMISFVASCFVEGTNDFPKNVEIGRLYFEYGIKMMNETSLLLYTSFILNKKINPPDFESTIESLSNAAQKIKSSKSMLLIGQLILSKQTFDINSKENENVNFFLAKQLFKESSELGNIKSKTEYAKICMREKSNKYGKIKREILKSSKLFKEASDFGDGEAMAYYGYFLEFGYGNILVNKKKAYQYYRLSYEKDDLSGYALYGYTLIDGSFGIPTNESKGIELIKYSAERNNPFGLNTYGWLLTKGFPGLNISLTRSHQYIQKASYVGFQAALNNIGIDYKNGVSIKKDIQKAIKFFILALEEGSGRAAFNLGKMLINGDGIKQNKEEGAKYLKISADIGFRDAIYEYCSYLSDDEPNLLKNLSELKEYLELGVKLKDPYTIKLYAALIFDGKSFPVDKSKGIDILKIAIEMGDKGAMELYADVLSHDYGIVKKNSSEARKYKQMASRIVEKNENEEYFELKIIDFDFFSKLDKNCQKYILRAEKGDHESLLFVAKAFINGSDGFPSISKIGEKYLIYAINDFINDKFLLDINRDSIKNYFEIGIDLNITYCMRLYGLLLIYGNIFSKNEKEGYKYLKMAADLGNIGAMKDFAVFLEKGGDSIPKDQNEANKYREMAHKS